MHYGAARSGAKQQVLAPPVYGSDFQARQFCFKVRIHGPTQPAITDYNALDPITNQAWRYSAPGRFNFR
jgi:hypothetical protein